MISEIKNEFVKIQVSTKGAELQSIKDADEGIEYLWQADPKVWSRHAPILFPIVGKLKDDKCVIENGTYSMTQHGFARDMEFQLISKTEDSLSFQLVSNEETEKKYPYKFNLLVEYKIEGNSVEVKYKVKNKDDKEINFSIGAHPGFVCPLFNDESFEDYYIEFSDKENAYTHLIENGYISGEKQLILENENIIPLNRQLFKDDALIFKGMKSNKVAIKSNKRNKGIVVDFTGFPYLGIWSKPDGTGNFVCIEPWYGITDSLNSDGIFSHKEGIISLKADSSFECKFKIEIK